MSISGKEDENKPDIDFYDWGKGTPSKLKDISITEFEDRLSLLVNELIGEGADTETNINKLDFTDSSLNALKLSVTFSKKIDFSFDSE